MKISAVYKITNTVNGNFYIGSSKDVKQRLAYHKCHSSWNEHPNNPMYQDMQKYGLDKFAFEILAEVEEEHLKEVEQQFIEALKPIYNNYNAKGLNVGRRKESKRKYNKEYRKSHKEKILEQMKQYYESNKEKIKQQKKQYYESNKEEILEQVKQHYESNKEQKKQYYESNKEQKKQYQNQYDNQLCYYNGETLTLCALYTRFRRAGIDHPTAEAKKYLLEK